MTGKGGQSLINIGLLVGSLSLSLILAELSVRIFCPQTLITPLHDLYCPDSTFGSSHIPNLRKMKNTGEGRVHFYTDRNGYRINWTDTDSAEETEPDISILVIGDSFVESLPTENEDAIPEQIAGMIRGKYGLRCKAVNAGHGGRGPERYYLEAKRSLALQHFDLGIVCIYVGNDFNQVRIDTNFNPALRKSPRRRPFIPYHFRLFRVRMDEFLGSKSQLYSLIKQQILLEAQKYGQHFSYLPDSFLIREKSSPRWQVAATLCRMTKEVFDRYNTPVFFVLLPTLYQVQEEKFYEYLDFMKIPRDSVDLWQPNVIINDLFPRYNLHLVDVCSYMREKARRGVKMYGTRDRHFTKEGNRAVAEAVFPVVEEYLADKLQPGNTRRKIRGQGTDEDRSQNHPPR